MVKKTTYFFVVLALFSVHLNSWAQDPYVDSLITLLKNSKHDTITVRLLVQLSEQAGEEESFGYTQRAVEIIEKLLADKKLNSKRISLLELKAAAYNNMGYSQRNKADIGESADYYKRSLKIRNDLHDTLEIGTILSNLGALYFEHGNIPLAVEYIGKALKLQEACGDSSGAADSFNFFASIYMSQKDYDKGLEYCKRALALQLKLDNYQEIARCYSNIGAFYAGKKEYETALEYYTLALKMLERLNYEVGIAHTLSNIGSVYHSSKDYPNALKNFYQSLSLQKKAQNPTGIIAEQLYIGSVYYLMAKDEKSISAKKKDISISRAYLDSSITLSKETGYIHEIPPAEEKLCKVDSMTGNYKGAYDHYKLFIFYRDSINSEKNRRASIKSQLSYEYDKKEAVLKEQQEKERVVAEEKNLAQKIIILSVALGLVLVLIFAFYVFRSLKKTNEQKYIIEEKQKEILDSIRYAKRIQRSLLTPEKYIDKNMSRLKS